MTVWPCVPALPTWLQQATLGQVVRHLAGLPPAGALEDLYPGQDWTTARAMEAFRHAPPPVFVPGSRFSYSNVGYILLAHVVESASGKTFADFVQEALFGPLDRAAMSFPPIGDRMGFAQLAGMGPNRPLSHGDGGLWTTARGFVGWLDSQNCDALGISELVEAPARLPDGTVVDYGWGIGLRTHRGKPLFAHGGSWRGACCKAVRSRAFGVSIAVFAADHAEQDNVGLLVDMILDAST